MKKLISCLISFALTFSIVAAAGVATVSAADYTYYTLVGSEFIPDDDADKTVKWDNGDTPLDTSVMRNLTFTGTLNGEAVEAVLKVGEKKYMDFENFEGKTGEVPASSEAMGQWQYENNESGYAQYAQIAKDGNNKNVAIKYTALNSSSSSTTDKRNNRIQYIPAETVEAKFEFSFKVKIEDATEDYSIVIPFGDGSTTKNLVIKKTVAGVYSAKISTEKNVTADSDGWVSLRIVSDGTSIYVYNKSTFLEIVAAAFTNLSNVKLKGNNKLDDATIYIDDFKLTKTTETEGIYYGDYTTTYNRSLNTGDRGMLQSSEQISYVAKDSNQTLYTDYICSSVDFTAEAKTHGSYTKVDNGITWNVNVIGNDMLFKYDFENLDNEVALGANDIDIYDNDKLNRATATVKSDNGNKYIKVTADTRFGARSTSGAICGESKSGIFAIKFKTKFTHIEGTTNDENMGSINIYGINDSGTAKSVEQLLIRKKSDDEDISLKLKSASDITSDVSESWVTVELLLDIDNDKVVSYSINGGEHQALGSSFANPVAELTEIQIQPVSTYGTIDVDDISVSRYISEYELQNITADGENTSVTVYKNSERTATADIYVALYNTDGRMTKASVVKNIGSSLVFGENLITAKDIAAQSGQKTGVFLLTDKLVPLAQGLVK